VHILLQQTLTMSGTAGVFNYLKQNAVNAKSGTFPLSVLGTLKQKFGKNMEVIKM
jgi:hypothetical protein